MAYVARLTNGVSHDLTGQVGALNGNYAQDSYFNFQLPSNATNLRVTLVDDGSQTFFNDNGWLIVQRGQQPSSNDSLSTAETIWTDGMVNSGNLNVGYQPAATAGAFALVVPSAQTLSGEWFVTLDMLATLQGGSLTVEWDHGGNSPETRSNVIAGNNGQLMDGDDFLFTIPAASAPSTPVYTYWTFDVPVDYTLTAVLNDNAAGDLAASVTAGTNLFALALTVSGDFSTQPPINGNYPDYTGVAYSNVPMAVSYTNKTAATVTVYVNVGSMALVPAADVRLMLNCVAGVQWLPNSDHEPDLGGGTNAWYSDYTALTGSGFNAGSLPTTENLLAAFSAAESPYPASYLNAFPAQPDPTVNTQGYEAYARFTQTSTLTLDMAYNNEDGTQGGIGYVCGYTPVYYPVAVYPIAAGGTNTILLSPTNKDTFEQPCQMAILMAYELIALTWTRASGTGTPTWTSIRREVRFVLDRGYSATPFSNGVLTGVDVLSSTGLVLNSGSTPNIPSLEQVYSSASQGAEVASFGYDVSYTVGDVIPEGPAGQEQRDLQSVLSTVPASTYLVNVNGIDTVHTTTDWTANATIMFVDDSQTGGQLVSGTPYFLGINYAQLI